MSSIKFPYLHAGIWTEKVEARTRTNYYGGPLVAHTQLVLLYFKLLLWSRAGSEIIFYHYSNSELPLSLVHDQSD